MFSRRCEQAHTHTQKINTHPHSIGLFVIFTTRYTVYTHTIPKTASKQTPALVYCHCARERQGEVGGHGYSVHNIAESEN